MNAWGVIVKYSSANIGIFIRAETRAGQGFEEIQLAQNLPCGRITVTRYRTQPGRRNLM